MPTLQDFQETLNQTETNIANAYTAVEDKGGTIPQNKNLDNLVDAIDSIDLGTDVSDTTAIAGDVLSGEDFYLADGTKATGTIQTYSGATTITSNQTLATAGKYVSSDITVNVPAPILTTKNITQNGTYNASSDSADGYSSVIVAVPSDNPLIATTDNEMNALLISANNGKVAKFTGTSSTYDTNAYYIIEESV